MALQNLQAEIAEAIFSDEESINFIRPKHHLIIHQNNIFLHLTRALKNIYPLIVQLVGEDFFGITAKEYIKHYPARSGDLHEYGEYFSDFLAEYQPLHDLIYLAEVAQFEWLCHTIYFAASHPAFDIARLEKINPEQYDQLHFILHPASKVVKFYYPILRIIDLCKGAITENLDINEGGVELLIIRRENDLSITPLQHGDYIFLSSLQDNLALSQALDATLIVDPAFQLEEKLPIWIGDKTLVDCYQTNE